jgi:hypothetical protein
VLTKWCKELAILITTPVEAIANTVELGYTVCKGMRTFCLYKMTVTIAEEYVMVNSEKLIGTTKYLMLQMRCYTNRRL